MHGLSVYYKMLKGIDWFAFYHKPVDFIFVAINAGFPHLSLFFMA